MTTLPNYIIRKSPECYLISIMCNAAQDQCNTAWTSNREEASLFSGRNLLRIVKQLRNYCPNQTFTTIHTLTGATTMTKATDRKEFIINDGNINKYLTGWMYADGNDMPLTSWRAEVDKAARMSETEAKTLIDDMTDAQNTNFTMQECVPDAVAMNPQGTEPAVDTKGNKQFLIMTDDKLYVKTVDWNADGPIAGVRTKILSVTNTEKDAGLFNKMQADCLLEEQPYVLGYFEVRVAF